MGQASQASWVCVTCRLKNKEGSTTKESEGDASEDDFEVSSLGVQRSILSKANALMEMKEKLSSIEASMAFLATKYDALLTEVTGLREENKDLKKEVDVLKGKLTSTDRFAEDLACELAELNQYGRRMNLEINGVRVEGDPKKEEIKTVLEKLASDIGVDFNTNEIHQAHRLQSRGDGRPPTILIQFHSKTTRDTWLQKGKTAKLPNTFFGENLCPQYRHLLRDTKIRCNTHSYKFVWVKGGRIMVKRNEAENNVIIIRTNNDLKKIK